MKKQPVPITDIKHPAQPSKSVSLKQKVPLILLILLLTIVGSYTGVYLYNL